MTASKTAAPQHFSLPATDRRILRERFKRRHWIRLPRFLKPSTLKKLEEQIHKAEFFEVNPMGRKDAVSSRQICSTDLGPILNLLLSDQALFDFVEDVGNFSQRIKCMAGAVYRQTSSKKHYLHWHDDVNVVVGESTLATLVVNIGGAYKGGRLEIRSPKTGKVVSRVSNARRGGALLLRSSVTHRSRPVVGPEPKLLFLGLMLLDRPGGASTSPTGGGAPMNY
jgi:hypothetical protein